MSLIQQFRRFFFTMSLAVVLGTIIAFGFGYANSWAADSLTELISQPQTQLATMNNKIVAITKNIEGKVQEAIGDITGDPKDQLMGQAKQVQSQAINATEDIKDSIQLTGRAKAVTKNLEGKFQEASGEATGNRKDQVVGKAKQVESGTRNFVEDIKDKVRDIFN